MADKKTFVVALVTEFKSYYEGVVMFIGPLEKCKTFCSLYDAIPFTPAPGAVETALYVVDQSVFFDRETFIGEGFGFDKHDMGFAPCHAVVH